MVKGNIESAFPLTPLQEGMLYHALRDPSSGFYHGQVRFTLEGQIQSELLRQAFQRAVDRHESLRTFFAWQGRDRPLQVVRGRVELPWTALDWRSAGEEERSARWQALAEDDLRRPFELSTAPLTRVTCVRFGEDSYGVLWSVHHAVSDGWSGSLIVREVLEDYEALASNAQPPDRPAPPSFSRFVGWIESRNAGAEETHWRERLASFHTPTPLPFSTGSPTRTAGITRIHRVSEERYARLRQAAAAMRVTPATMVAGAWAVLLGRYAGSDDVVFGSTVSRRPADIPGVGDATGLYLSTIPVRATLSESDPPSKFLRDLQRSMSEDRSHGSAGLARIARWSGVAHTDPLFRTVVVFESFPDSVAGPSAGGTLRPSQMSIDGPSDLPLGLVAIPDRGLTLQLKHDPGLYDEQAARRLLDQVASILDELIDANVSSLAELSCLTPEHREAVTHRWSHGPDLARHPSDVLALIQHESDANPESIALRSSSGTMQYGELERAANNVAQALVDRGIGPGSLVAIPASRTEETVVAFLAVLKTGAAYAPMDPGLPPVRRDQLLDRFDLVLRPRREDWADIERPILDLQEAMHGSAEKLHRPYRPDGPAYVMFTSGSTGMPKGVIVTRSNLAHSTQARLDSYERNPSCFLLLSPLWVDSSIAGLFWTLATGGTVAIPRAREEQDLRALAATIQAARVTHTLMVPSLYGALLEELDAVSAPDLTTVIVAGESATTTLVERHIRLMPGSEIFNEYGPSEATVWATVANLTEESDGPVTIGRPIPSYRVYILDDSSRPVGVGIEGDLVIGGPGVALEYLGDPAQSAERFSSDPFGGVGRVYYTGDRGRWLDDGRIQFLGRRDQQVKIRGFRVEVEEIESALTTHPHVAEVAVDASEQEGIPTVLTAYLVGEGPAPRSQDLDRWLSERVPRYMIPSRYIVVDGLPRTSSGKLDRPALPSLDGHPLSIPSGPAQAPRTPAEETLAEIWQSVLGLDRVGVHDDFFELGGDSLSSIRVLSRASRAGFEIDPQSFFRTPTVAAMAASEPKEAPVASISAIGQAPLTPIQRWFFSTVRDDPEHWNQDRVLQFEAKVLPVADARRIIATLLEYHDALRTQFVFDAEGRISLQNVPHAGTPRLQVLTAGAYPDTAAEQIFIDACNLNHRSMDLAAGDLFRAVILEHQGDVRLMALVTHHLVIDAVSWNVVLEDLAALIDQGRSGSPLRLPPKTEPFVAWARGLNERAATLDSHALIQATDRPSQEASPCGRRGMTTGRAGEGRTEIVRFPAPAFAALDAARGTLEASLEELIITGFLIGWRKWCGDHVLRMDLEGHGRDVGTGRRGHVHRTVGWFTTVSPFRCRLGATHLHTLRNVQRAIRAARGSGVDQTLLRYLSPEAEVRETLAAGISSDVVFNYLGLRTPHFDGAPFSLRPDLAGLARSPSGQRAYALEVNAYQTGSELEISIEGGPGSTAELPRLTSAVYDALMEVKDIDEAEFEIDGFGDTDYDTVARLLGRLDFTET